jgi:hypothetical protein
MSCHEVEVGGYCWDFGYEVKLSGFVIVSHLAITNRGMERRLISLMVTARGMYGIRPRKRKNGLFQVLGVVLATGARLPLRLLVGRLVTPQW